MLRVKSGHSLSERAGTEDCSADQPLFHTFSLLSPVPGAAGGLEAETEDTDLLSGHLGWTLPDANSRSADAKPGMVLTKQFPGILSFNPHNHPRRDGLVITKIC